jgi:hypothetical protein
VAKSDQQRRIDVAEAKANYSRRRKALVTMDEIAAVYGLTKPAMHNLHKTVTGFPEWTERKGNTHFYPAYKVFTSLLAYLERNEKMAAAQAAQFSELVRPPTAGDGFEVQPMTASEQLKALDLRQRLIDEAVDQGHLHRADHCAAVSDRVFTKISTTFGRNLADAMDPNGRWPGWLREDVTERGKQLVLQCFAEMKDMLTAGVVETPQDANGKSTRPAGPPRKRRGPRERGQPRAG